MAENAITAPPPVNPGESKKSGSKLIIIVIAVVVCLALAGGGYWFKTRRAMASSKKQGAPPAAQKADAAPVAIIPLDSFVVNLADPGHSTFLRIGISLGLDKPLPKGGEGEGDSPLTPEIRDAILSVVTNWTSTELLAPDGKIKLKAQLRHVLQERLPQMGIAEVYFTDFLIQE